MKNIIPSKSPVKNRCFSLTLNVPVQLHESQITRVTDVFMHKFNPSLRPKRDRFNSDLRRFRLSRAMTLLDGNFSFRASARCDPTKPAPPVTKILKEDISNICNSGYPYLVSQQSLLIHPFHSSLNSFLQGEW